MKIDPQIEEPVESLTFEEEGPLIYVFSYVSEVLQSNDNGKLFFFHNDYGAHNSKAS